MEYTAGRIVKAVTALIIIVALGWLFYTLSSILTILIISFLVAYILDPVASYFESHNLSRTQATAVIFLLFAGVLAALFSHFVPSLIDDLSKLQQVISSGEASKYFSRIENFIATNLPLISVEELDLQGRITRAVTQLTNSFFMILGSMVSLVTTLVIIPFAVFFLLKDGPVMMKNLFSIVPNRYFEMSLNIIYKINQQLGSYLRGQFFDALIIGVLSIIALWILNVPYYVMIGIFAGLTNMVPYVGPLAGGSVAVLVVLFTGGSGLDALLVIMAFALIQLVDNVLVQPLVVSKSVNLHPLLIIFSVTIGGQFFGILGMLLAVPATQIIKVLILEFYHGIRRYHMI